MKTFEAQPELNKILRYPMGSINYKCEKFDLNILKSKELVNVSLGEMMFECFASSVEGSLEHGLTSVVFTIYRRIA